MFITRSGRRDNIRNMVLDAISNASLFLQSEFEFHCDQL
jgi:hypothetical protein